MQVTIISPSSLVDPSTVSYYYYFYKNSLIFGAFLNTHFLVSRFNGDKNSNYLFIRGKVPTN